MELRTLEYFAMVVQEGSITNAAKTLHVTQPTLSRQLALLEEELGTQLFTRGHKGITLTAQGITLNRYATSILHLAERALEEVSPSGATIAGPIHMAAGETPQIGVVARALANVQREHPGVYLVVHNGDTAAIMDDLQRGSYDLFLECEVRSHKFFNMLELPEPDVWGVVVREDSELAALPVVTPADLVGRDVIMPVQATNNGTLPTWLGDVRDTLRVVSNYSLPSNMRYLVREGLGALFTYQGIFDVGGDSGLAFVPLEPRLESRQGLVWRKTKPNAQTELLLDELRRLSGQA